MTGLTRRMVLAGLALGATPLAGAGYAPPAVTLVRAVPGRPSALGLQIADATGAALTLDRWRGRWVVLNLWAPWCLPCRREMPSLQRLADTLDQDRFAVLPLAFDRRGPIWIRKFYREEQIDGFPVLMGDGANLDAVLGLTDLPTTALIDPDGRHAFTVAGEAQWDDPASLTWLNGLTR